MKSLEPRITILVDNNAQDPLLGEHGLALWIEWQGRKILLDTGQGEALVPNASRLGIDLGETDIMVLSHGHYDHTGAVPEVLEQSPDLEVYLDPAVFLPRYSIRSGEARPIGIPAKAMSSLLNHPEARVHWVNGPIDLGDGMHLTGPIPRTNAFEDPGGPFFLDPQGKKPDIIKDDLALWIASEQGLVVCTGCCHSGIVNTLRYIMELSGQSRVYRVIGGLHLVNAGSSRLEETVDALGKIRIEELVPCHCTGDRAVEFLSKHLKHKVTPGFAGMRISIVPGLKSQLKG